MTAANVAITKPSRRTTRPLVFGVVGVGGYAGVVCEQLISGAGRENPPVTLAAACEPDVERHAETIGQLRGRGVRVYRDAVDLLASAEVEAVWLPLPIGLHRRFTERALAAGKAVMCEKPAAGCVQDVDAMIAARDAAGLPVAVGFQDIYDPQVLRAKRAILDGEIGGVVSATVHACWPRDERYYARNAWAGKLKQDGQWVLDGPANNAMAHFLNLALFLIGEEERASATPVAVEAELYRANPVENYDTCSIRLTTASGARVLVLLTHASATAVEPTVTVRGTRGDVAFVEMREVVINGLRTRRASQHAALHGHMQDAFAEWVRGWEAGAGESPARARAIATLEVARAHTVAVNGASEASPVRTIPARSVTAGRDFASGAVLRSIPGIEQAFARCARSGQMLHESRVYGWTAAGGRKDLRGYSAFAGPAGIGAVDNQVQQTPSQQLQGCRDREGVGQDTRT